MKKEITRMFHSLKTILNKDKNKLPQKPLGRWSLDYKDNKLNIKLDNANEDHCGCCKNSKEE